MSLRSWSEALAAWQGENAACVVRDLPRVAGGEKGGDSMLTLWKCSEGVTVQFKSGSDYEWRIGDSDPGLVGPLVLMADGDELAIILRAIRGHSWKGAEPGDDQS